MTPPDPLEVATPADDAELRALLAVVSQALLVPGAVTASWPEHEERACFRMARIGGQIVGGLSVQRMGQWFGGRPVGTGCIRAVGVRPEARARGIARRLLRHVLAELRDDGIPLSTLYPATQTPYRRAGYEQAGTRITYRMPIAAIRSRDRALDVRPVGEGGSGALHEPYREAARRTGGLLDRNPWMWRRVLAPAGEPPSVYVTGRSGAVEGYLVYGQWRPPDTVRGEMRLLDLVALTPEAAQRLLTLIADHGSVLDEVQWHGGHAQPMFCLLDGQSYRVAARWEWMLRLVDVERALVARGWPEAVDAEVHLEVRDDVLPWNDGRIVLEVAKGSASVRRGGDGRVRIDVRGLAPLYSGHLSPRELRTAGTIDGDERDLARLQAMFAGPSPWMPDFF